MENQTLILLAILLLITSTWTVLHYAKRRTSCIVLLLCIAAFGLGSAAVALLPIDLSYASAATAASSSSSSSGENVDDANNNDDDVNTTTTTSTAASTNPTYLPWQITYWTTFLFAYILLPITRETLLSGQFTTRQRLREGITKSTRSIFFMSIAGICTILAMAIHLKSFHIVTIVLPVLMAMGNTYGLCLVVLLLGNGLINIPKKLWREACPANELRRSRIMACGAEEELFDAVMVLEDVEDRIEEVCLTAVNLREGGETSSGIIMCNESGDVILGGDNGSSRRGRRSRAEGKCCIGMLCCCCFKTDDVTEFHECLEELVRRKNETANLCSERRTRHHRGGGGGGRRRHSSGSNTSSDDDNNGRSNAGGEINTMDIKYLVSLSGQLKRAQERVTSAQLRWNHLMGHNLYFSALMDDGIPGGSRNGRGNNNQDDDDDESTRSNLLSLSSFSNSQCCHKLRYTIQRCWVHCLRYPTYRAISLLTATLSTFVLLSEITLSSGINLSPFSWTLKALDNYHYQTSGTRILFQIMALIPLLYMSLCVYISLFQMSTLGPYCLRGNRQSNGVALVFNAQYLVRLQFPLGYNYLLMLKYDMTHCAFNDIMSDMSTIPFFGTSFSVYAPLLILAVCLFTLCDFYPRILRFLGIDHEDALLLGDKEELDEKANEGIQLMKRDAERRGAATAADGGGQSSPEKQSLNSSSRRNIIV